MLRSQKNDGRTRNACDKKTLLFACLCIDPLPSPLFGNLMAILAGSEFENLRCARPATAGLRDDMPTSPLSTNMRRAFIGLRCRQSLGLRLRFGLAFGRRGDDRRLRLRFGLLCSGLFGRRARSGLRLTTALGRTPLCKQVANAYRRITAARPLRIRRVAVIRDVVLRLIVVVSRVLRQDRLIGAGRGRRVRAGLRRGHDLLIAAVVDRELQKRSMRVDAVEPVAAIMAAMS